MAPITLFISNSPLCASVGAQITANSLGIIDETPKKPLGDMVIFDQPPDHQKWQEKITLLCTMPPQTTLLFLGDEKAVAAIQDKITEVIPLPLRLGYLMARIQFHLHIINRSKNNLVHFAGFSLDVHKKQITHSEMPETIHLTDKECALLCYLAEHKNADRTTLLANVWGYGPRVTTHTLETHIYHLRRKLDYQNLGLDIIHFSNDRYSLMD